MGLDNRDYLREESRRYSEGFSGGSFFAGAPMCRRILIATIVVFVLQLMLTRPWTADELQGMQNGKVLEFTQRNDEFRLDQLERLPFRPQDYGFSSAQSLIEEWGQLDLRKVMSGQVWRLITCAFLHSRTNLFHIVFNMLIFFQFGRTLETLLGSRELLCLYLAAALASSLCYIGLDLVTGDIAPMIGASGAVLGVLAVFAVQFPRQILRLLGVFSIEARWLAIGITVIDLLPVLSALSGQGSSDGVAHAAHVGGLAFGYFYGTKRWIIYPFFSGIERFWQAKRRGLKVVRPSIPAEPPVKTQKLIDETDAILKKISEHGEASLTNAERKTLEKASRELRNRRT